MMLQKYRLLFRLLSLALVTAILSAAIPQPAAAQSRPSRKDCPQFYRVRPGDMLLKIAEAYRVDWRELARINDIEYPFDIYYGTRLCIPTRKQARWPTDAASGPVQFRTNLFTSVLVLHLDEVPARSIFNVRVRDETGGSAWRKVGTLRAGDSTAVSGSFDLPRALQTASSLTICLKNVRNDRVSCRTIDRP